jgi:colicin import membrane protein
MRHARLLQAVCLGLLVGLGAAAHALEPASDAAQREQVKTERAAAEARYKQAEADCSKRFAVSGCLAEAQAQRREAMTGLRAREVALDEAQRKADAEESARRVQAKQAEAASKPPPVPRAASAPASAAASAAAGRASSERARQRSKTAEDATLAAARVAAQQRRASEAAAHRQEVEQRNAERSARGKKSTPLPVPSAASVAATASAPAR